MLVCVHLIKQADKQSSAEANGMDLMYFFVRAKQHLQQKARDGHHSKICTHLRHGAFHTLPGELAQIPDGLAQILDELAQALAQRKKDTAPHPKATGAEVIIDSLLTVFLLTVLMPISLTLECYLFFVRVLVHVLVHHVLPVNTPVKPTRQVFHQIQSTVRSLKAYLYPF